MYDRLERAAAWAFPAMMLAVVASTLIHLRDRFGINHVSGAQLALTRHFQDGRLDPPFFAPPVIGGTRFSPIPTLIHAGIDVPVDDLLVSGRIMTSAFALASGGLVFWICRTYGVTRRWAAVAGAVTLATPEIFTVATSIRQDMVALGFVLATFALARSYPSRPALALAGACTSLAVFSKPTAGVDHPRRRCAPLERSRISRVVSGDRRGGGTRCLLTRHGGQQRSVSRHPSAPLRRLDHARVDAARAGAGVPGGAHDGASHPDRLRCVVLEPSRSTRRTRRRCGHLDGPRRRAVP